LVTFIGLSIEATKKYSYNEFILKMLFILKWK